MKSGLQGPGIAVASFVCRKQKSGNEEHRLVIGPSILRAQICSAPREEMTSTSPRRWGRSSDVLQGTASLRYQRCRLSGQTSQTASRAIVSSDNTNLTLSRRTYGPAAGGRWQVGLLSYNCDWPRKTNIGGSRQALLSCRQGSMALTAQEEDEQQEMGWSRPGA